MRSGGPFGGGNPPNIHPAKTLTMNLSLKIFPRQDRKPMGEKGHGKEGRGGVKLREKGQTQKPSSRNWGVSPVQKLVERKEGKVGRYSQGELGKGSTGNEAKGLARNRPSPIPNVEKKGPLGGEGGKKKG